MKERYEAPRVDVVNFITEDVITTSNKTPETPFEELLPSDNSNGA